MSTFERVDAAFSERNGPLNAVLGALALRCEFLALLGTYAPEPVDARVSGAGEEPGVDIVLGLISLANRIESAARCAPQTDPSPDGAAPSRPKETLLR